MGRTATAGKTRQVRITLPEAVAERAEEIAKRSKIPITYLNVCALAAAHGVEQVARDLGIKPTKGGAS